MNPSASGDMRARFLHLLERLRNLSWHGTHLLIGTALVLLACYIYIAQPRWIEPIQNWTFDTYQRLHPRVPDYTTMPARVVIIDIDEASLDAYGQWPWPRTVLAKLVESLRDYGVLVTGFDIVFAEPDRTSPRQLRNTLTDIPDTMRHTLDALPDHDTRFAEAIAGGKVVLGQVGERKEVAAGRLHPKARFGAKQTSFDAPALDSLLRRYPGAVLNLAPLEAAADGIGLFSTLPDGDGVYRKVAMLERISDANGSNTVFPALSLEMIRVALGGADSAFVEIDANGIRQILLKSASGGVFKIPTDRYGRIWVHFARYPTGAAPLYLSAKAVLEHTAPPEALAGKLAVVGTSAIGLKDIRATPISAQMPGVEVHAQVMETILANSHLKREVSHFWKLPFVNIWLSIWVLELFSIFAGGMLMVLLVPRLNAMLTFLAGAGVIGTLVAIGWYHYLERQVLVDYTYPALSIFAVFFILTYLNYMREEAQRKQIRHAFGHYVSPALLEQLARNPEKLALGGETRHLTVLFSDIRGFTSISERFNAQELTRFINRFLTPMTNVILTRKGTVDKYMGDAIMAFWNAPLPDADHPRNACHAALAMQQAVKELNVKLAEEASNVSPEDTSGNRRHYVPIHIGVGINSGQCCVGNMGSEQRFDYSALGDDVNLASRLEGQSKTYGVDIVLGENTVREIEGEFAYIELDLIRVKGKNLPARTYALLGDAGMREDPLFQEVNATMNHLLAAYRAREWNEAETAARKLAKLHRPLTDLARLYINRIREYRDTPPPEGWDGSYVATAK